MLLSLVPSAYASHPPGMHLPVYIGTASTFATLVTKITDFLTGLILFVCGVVFVVGALFMVVGGVKEEQKQKGKDLMVSSLIGFAVVLAARAILNTIMFLLT